MGTLHPFPAIVQRETASYREEENPLGEFIRDWVVHDDDASTLGTKVYEEYAHWTSLVGLKAMTAPVFGRAFTERHDQLGWLVHRHMVHGRAVYDGLIVRRPPE